ncbi:MAG TPA: AI-2E family transporter [Actinomycetota bacterium]|nr:AI-2E family transporter [Actinomycetota bacterium]
MESGGPEELADGLPGWFPRVLRIVSIRAVWVLIVATIGTLVILYLVRRLSDFFAIILTALFLSFAIEPAVNWFAGRGMRRGAATGLMFVFILIAVAILLMLIVPAIVSGFRQLVANANTWVATISRWLDQLGITVDQARLTEQIRSRADDIVGYATNFAGQVFGIATSILGGLFRWATIALFTFYFVAEGPQLRRVICGALPPESQQRVLFVWDQAIDKTGGYFYSRLLLAAINGTGMYITLRVFGVPFAAPLAVFEGVVSEFIPIVGTYIAGAAPIGVAFLVSPAAGIGALVYVLAYQQLENYILSPRLTARTMNLHPAVAFAAALIGGQLGGILAAFLALPVAAVIQASIQEYGRRYAVVESPLTGDMATPSPTPPGEPRASWWERVQTRIGRRSGGGSES